MVLRTGYTTPNSLASTALSCSPLSLIQSTLDRTSAQECTNSVQRCTTHRIARPAQRCTTRRLHKSACKSAQRCKNCCPAQRCKIVALHKGARTKPKHLVYFILISYDVWAHYSQKKERLSKGQHHKVDFQANRARRHGLWSICLKPSATVT